MTSPTKETTATLNRALRLPATGKEQDWDIELADASRVGEFADSLEHQARSDQERQALMALTLASLNDLAQTQVPAPELVQRVQHLLQSDATLYAGLVRQWSPTPNDPTGFAISGMISSVKAACTE